MRRLGRRGPSVLSFMLAAAVLAAVLGLAATAGAAAEAPQGTTLFVSPSGRPGNPGTQQQPLGSLEAARDAARKAPAGPKRIVLLPGDYFLAHTFELDARDNGLTIEAARPGSATLYGGTPVTLWRREGPQFWSAELPGVKEGRWDFRALTVNGRLCDRARLPASGTFLHHSTFNVPWLSTVGGGWERKPTPEELTTMLYDPHDIPATLEVRNAEIRVYHMWDESMVGLARNDTERHALIFAPAAKSPAGAFGVKKYVIFNTREGMTRPGQWYLDRPAGRVVYWPLPGEEMTQARVIAPRLERLMRIAGSQKQPVEGITLRGLALQSTTTPLMAGGFGAYAFDAALRVEWARQCGLEKLEISNVGGQGLLAWQLLDSHIDQCHIHHTGACGMKVDGSGTKISQNHVHHIGVYYPSAVALSADGHAQRGLHLYRNEIHDAPYSGIVLSGRNHLVEENLIYRVMREMQDGGAIYGGVVNCILRGNVVRDVVKMGEGYGVSSYYLDEGARDCVVERNVSIGVERPTHNHIATNTVIRDNVFMADGDMLLSFQRSRGCTVENNMFFTPGKITVTPPSAVKEWKGNVLFLGGASSNAAARAFTIDDALPPAPEPKHITWGVTVPRAAHPPALDGQYHAEDWPGGLVRLDREPSRWPATGAPVYAYFTYDDRFLYVAVNVAMFEAGKVRSGTAWGQDDGAELSLAGRGPDGRPVTYVIRGYAGGAVESVTDAGAPSAAAAALGRNVRFVAKPYGKTMGGWRGQWVIPWESLGLKPAAGLKVPFNLAVYRSEDGAWRCWEGTRAENWRLDQAGFFFLK